MTDRCVRQGLNVRRELQIRVGQRNFFKDYFADLLIEEGVIVEVKTVRDLVDSHRSQGINYLLLTETNHGSLINFRPSKVEREFLSTGLAHKIRTHFEIIEISWPEETDPTRLNSVAIQFCQDVGLGLALQKR